MLNLNDACSACSKYLILILFYTFYLHTWRLPPFSLVEIWECFPLYSFPYTILLAHCFCSFSMGIVYLHIFGIVVPRVLHKIESKSSAEAYRRICQNSWTYSTSPAALIPLPLTPTLVHSKWTIVWNVGIICIISRATFHRKGSFLLLPRFCCIS